MKHLFFSLFLACAFSLLSEAAGVITVGGRAYPVDTIAYYNVGPGSRFTNINLLHEKEPLLVHFLEVDATNPYVKFSAETAKDAMKGLEGITSIAKRKTSQGNVYFAGTNGDFYDLGTGIPVNGFASMGEIGRKPISDRPVIATTGDKFPLLDFMTFEGTVSFGADKFNISNTNAGRGANQLILFNRFQGGKTETNIYGTELLVELQEGDWAFNKQLKAKVVDKQIGVGNMLVPAGKVVLSGNGTAQSFLDKVNVGDEITLDLGLTLNSKPTENYDIKELVGGDRFILQDGQVTDNDWNEKHPRTSMGYSADGKKIYFCVVDGRSTFSAGVTTKVLAELMRLAGASTAFNLDGGGSSGLYIKEYGLVNNKGIGAERQVSNGFFVVSTAPEDNVVASIGFVKDRFELPVYSKLKPVIVSYNKYGQLLSKSVPATLSCSAELGSVNESNEFLAAGTETEGLLTATYQGITTTASMSIVNKAEVTLIMDSILIDNRQGYKIGVIGSLNGNEYPIDPLAVTWVVKNASVCRVDGGVLKGTNAGETLVIGTLGEYSDTLKVRVEPILESPYTMSKFDDPSKIQFTGSASNVQNISLALDGLPEGWAHGGRVNYTYASSGRFSTLKVLSPMVLYSLPDTMKLRVNLGESIMTSVALTFLANNSLIVKTVQIQSPASGQDIDLTFVMSELFPDDDFSKYPITFRDAIFYLTDSKHTKGKEYSIYLKDLKLFYEGYTSGIENVEFGQDRLVIYPNPAKNGEVTVVLPSEGNAAVKVEVLSMTGQVVKSVDFGVPGSNEITLPLHGLASGSYLVKVTEGNSKPVIGKLIIVQ